ncbi:MAG: hypothetical protein ACYCT6_08950 [bacterium]
MFKVTVRILLFAFLFAGSFVFIGNAHAGGATRTVYLSYGKDTVINFPAVINRVVSNKLGNVAVNIDDESVVVSPENTGAINTNMVVYVAGRSPVVYNLVSATGFHKADSMVNFNQKAGSIFAAKLAKVKGLYSDLYTAKTRPAAVTQLYKALRNIGFLKLNQNNVENPKYHSDIAAYILSDNPTFVVSVLKNQKPNKDISIVVFGHSLVKSAKVFANQLGKFGYKTRILIDGAKNNKLQRHPYIVIAYM